MDAKYREIYALAVQEAQSESEKQLDTMLLEIRNQVGFISDEMVRLIYQKANIPASYHEIYNWVRFGDSTVIAKTIAYKRVPSVSEIKQQVINEHAMKLRQYRRSVSALKKNCKECLPSTDLANRCCWVPAVCHCDDGKRIYGGVALTPMPRKVTLTMESVFSRVPLTPNFNGFRKKVKNPPVKPFNPPRVKGRKVPVRNGDPATSPTGGDSGGSSSSGDGEDCKNGGNLSGNGGNNVKNITYYVLSDGNSNVINPEY